MLRRFRLPFLLLAIVAATLVACTDRPAPTAPDLSGLRSDANVMGTCTTLANLTQLVNDVFGAGSPDANSALSKLKTLDRAVKKGDTTGAQDAARNLERFILSKAATLPGEQYVPQLLAAIECYAGLRDDAFLVYPSDQPQVIVNEAGTAGISLPANPVSEPTLIILKALPDTTTGLLDTKLDQYPGFLEITQESGVANSLVQPVVVGVCPAASINPSIVDRLRLGHQASAGFELTPDADASFLNCGNALLTGTAGAVPGWVQHVANLVLPKVAYASVSRLMFAGGGVGGTVTEFSPFAPVDPQLEFGGGVGGTVTEFTRVPVSGTSTAKGGSKTPARGQPMMLAGGVAPSAVDACGTGVTGEALPAECRPSVTIKTANGTILTGVPVSFSIGQGGGSTAIDNPGSPDCLAFGTSAATTTNVNGEARACWTLGAVGTNTLVATASAGGDAPSGVYFTPSANTFTVTAAKATASITLGDLNQTYTGSPLAASVTTTPAGLTTVNLTYDGLPTAPTAAGSYTVVATLDNPTYTGSATGTLVIAPAEQSAFTISGPSSLTFNAPAAQLESAGGSGTGAVTFYAGASTACSVTAAGALTMTSGTGTCSISAIKAADGNFVSATSNTLTVTPVKATATIALADLATTYTGDGKAATATTTPAGLAGVSLTYDGAAALPVDAGEYAVVASLSNADYAASNATGTLVISPALQAALEVTGATSVQFGGGAVTLGTIGGSGTGAVTFATAMGSTACAVTSSGSVTATAGTGTCAVTATKAADNNYVAVTSASYALTVIPGPVALSLSGLNATYDGTPKVVTVIATPSVPGTSVTYDGSATAPTNAGEYAVVGSLSNADYTATPVTGTLVIAKGTQAALTLTAPTGIVFGSTGQLSAVGGSGAGAISFASQTPATCSVAAATGVVTPLTGTGTCTVTATRAGDGNYEPVTSAAANIALGLASQSITFAPLPSRTYGDLPFAVSATASSDLPVRILATSGPCVVNAGTVTLTGAGSCTLQATQGGDGTFYANATPVSQTFAIAKRTATATAGSGSMSFGGAVPSLPCSVTGLLAADAGTVSCTTAVPSITVAGTYTTTPTVSPLNPANYQVTSVNGTLTVNGYVQQDCFAEPIKSIVPTTTSGITKGATLQVRCTLLNRNGTVVTNATGDLTVRDGGTTGNANGPVVLTVPNAFRLSSGVYTYKLSTNGLVKGNFYLVTARWNDGSTTTGWFYMNK